MFGYIHLPETSPEKTETTFAAREQQPAPAKKPRSGRIQRLLGWLDLIAGVAILITLTIIDALTGWIPWWFWKDDDR